VPLVTSDKARKKYGLPPLLQKDGTPLRFDALRPQRLAAPVTVYIEQFSAHPLEADAAELYAPPDGFMDKQGEFHRERTDISDRPVYEVRLEPEDGYYPLPYMARRVDGSAWNVDTGIQFDPGGGFRQSFFPDGSRAFEEIDRLSTGHEGIGSLISAMAQVDFYRIFPSAGYTKGLSGTNRTDVGGDDIRPETLGREFFPYTTSYAGAELPRRSLATLVNKVQQILSADHYDGAIWTQGSPRIEETIYWFNLLLDVTVPVCGTAAQRAHGEISNDGPKNTLDSVDYISSRVWAGPDGRNRAGMVMIQDQRVFAARDVMKVDARPGGYTATGGHGGVIGAAGHDGHPVLLYLPTTRHSYCSKVNINRLPTEVSGVHKDNWSIRSVTVPIKDVSGRLLEAAIPKVSIIKDGSYFIDDYEENYGREVDILALLNYKLSFAPLAGFVIEGLSPYGLMTSMARRQLMLRAVYSGLPVVCVGRGNTEGFAQGDDLFIGGSNLTATKARMLLMACIMKLGSLPPAQDADHPTSEELAETRTKVALYQSIFDTH
jgi:hypothetical protein